MTLDEAVNELKQRAAGRSAFGSRVKIDFGGDGQIMLDGTGAGNVIEAGNGDADCIVTMSLANFAAVLEGNLSPTTAFLTGRMKVSGDMGLAMRLAQLL